MVNTTKKKKMEHSISNSTFDLITLLFPEVALPVIFISVGLCGWWRYQHALIKPPFPVKGNDRSEIRAFSTLLQGL